MESKGECVERGCLFPKTIFKEATDGEPCPGRARSSQLGGPSTLFGMQVTPSVRLGPGKRFWMSRLSELLLPVPTPLSLSLQPLPARRITSTMESLSPPGRLHTQYSCRMPDSFAYLVASHIPFLHSGLRYS